MDHHGLQQVRVQLIILHQVLRVVDSPVIPDIMNMVELVWQILHVAPLLMILVLLEVRVTLIMQRHVILVAHGNVQMEARQLIVVSTMDHVQWIVSDLGQM